MSTQELKSRYSLSEYAKFMLDKIENKAFLFALVILSILASSLTLASATISKNIVNNVFVDLKVNYLSQIAPVIIFIYVISSVLSITYTYYDALFTTKFSSHVRLDFFNKLQKAPYQQLIMMGVNDLYYRMFNDTSVLVMYFFSLFVKMPVYILISILTASLMFFWSPQLTIFVLSFTFIQILISMIFRKPIRVTYQKLRDTEQTLANGVNEHFKIIDSIKIYGLEETSFNEFKDKFKTLNRNTLENTLIHTLYGIAINLLNQIWIFLMLVIGAKLIVQDSISIGTFMGIYILSGTLYTPLSSIIEILLRYQETCVSFKRYMEYYKYYSEIEYGGKKEFVFEHHIEISNLWFSYDRKNFVFEGLTIDIPKNAIIVVEGESGAGKSTLVKMLARLLFPEKGSIKVDNVELKDFEYSSLREGVCYTTQVPIIINDSVKNNVILDGTENVELFWDLMSDVGLREAVLKLADKENSQMGVGGYDFSEGEKQRLSLARAFYHMKHILLIDEPTAALDEKNKRQIIDAISKHQKRTGALTVVISHDKILNDIADYILHISGRHSYLEKI